jgi:hypothetical protein
VIILVAVRTGEIASPGDDEVSENRNIRGKKPAGDHPDLASETMQSSALPPEPEPSE